MLPSGLSRLYRRLLRPAQRAGTPTQESGEGPPRVVFVSTGPVAHFYLLDDTEPLTFEQLMQCCPQFMQAVADHKGVGFALARGHTGGAMIGVGGEWVDIHNDAALKRLGPEIVSAVHQSRAELIRWVNMPSAGDLLLFGYRGPAVPSISYTYERGGHAGPSMPERTPFVMVPADRADLWPEFGASGKRRIELRDLHERLRDTYGVSVAAAERRHVS